MNRKASGQTGELPAEPREDVITEGAEQRQFFHSLLTKDGERKLWISWWYKGKGDRFKHYSSGLREEEGLGYLLFTKALSTNLSNWFPDWLGFLVNYSLGKLGNMSSAQSLLQTTIFRVMNK